MTDFFRGLPFEFGQEIYFGWIIQSPTGMLIEVVVTLLLYVFIKNSVLRVLAQIVNAAAWLFLAYCLFLHGHEVLAVAYAAIIPVMLSDLAPILIAIVVILVLSASMSTLSSLVLTSSSTLTLDFLKGGVKKDMSEKQQLFIMKLMIVAFILISVILAIVQYKKGVTFIAQLMGVSWGALAGAFLAPFLYGLYWKRATAASCWVSFVFSTVPSAPHMRLSEASWITAN